MNFDERLEKWITDFYTNIDSQFFTTYVEKNIIIKKCDDPECNCIEEWEDSPTEIKIEYWYSKLESNEKLRTIDNYISYCNDMKGRILEENIELENTIDMLEEKIDILEEKPPAYNSEDSSLSSEQN